MEPLLSFPEKQRPRGFRGKEVGAVMREGRARRHLWGSVPPTAEGTFFSGWESVHPHFRPVAAPTRPLWQGMGTWRKCPLQSGPLMGRTVLHTWTRPLLSGHAAPLALLVGSGQCEAGQGSWVLQPPCQHSRLHLLPHPSQMLWGSATPPTETRLSEAEGEAGSPQNLLRKADAFSK